MKTCETCKWWEGPRPEDDTEFGKCCEPTRREGKLIAIHITKPYARCTEHEEKEK